MARTVTVHGSDGEVLACLGGQGEMCVGKWENIQIIDIFPDEDVPLYIRKAMVGLKTKIIFAYEYLKEHLTSKGMKRMGITQGAALAYLDCVVDDLCKSGKVKEADELQALSDDNLDMLVLSGESFKFIDKGDG